MKPPSAPKEDSSWVELKEYEVYLVVFMIELNK
jgi:hypothetical protein